MTFVLLGSIGQYFSSRDGNCTFFIYPARSEELGSVLGSYVRCFKVKVITARRRRLQTEEKLTSAMVHFRLLFP